MGLSSADLVVGQETRKLEEENVEGEATLRGKGWKASLEPCCNTELDGLSAGVAVAARKHVGMCLSVSEDKLPKAFSNRCRLAFVNAVASASVNAL